MKNAKKIFVLISSVFLLNACNSDRWKLKTFNQEMNFKKVNNKIFTGHGSFLLLINNDKSRDSVLVIGYSNFFDKIDNETLISKKSNSYTLFFQNLKEFNGIRYNDSIQLIYW